MIEHIVLSSGGPHGIVQVGVLWEAFKAGLLDMNNIKSIHGCSSGAIIGSLLCLKVPIDDMRDYVVSRKWEKCVHYDIHKFYETKGFFDIQLISDIVSPFLKAYDVPVTITLEEFFQLTKIEYDILTTDVAEMKSVTLNHTTHPTLPLITALMMSSAIPVVFPPVKYQDKYYLDGVYRRHCPMVNYPADTVMIIYIDALPATLPDLNDTAAYFQYILSTSYRILTESSSIPEGEFIVCRNIPAVYSPEFWKRILHEESYRLQMFDKGREIGKEFFDKKLTPPSEA